MNATVMSLSRWFLTAAAVLAGSVALACLEGCGRAPQRPPRAQGQTTLSTTSRPATRPASQPATAPTTALAEAVEPDPTRFRVGAASREITPGTERGLRQLVQQPRGTWGRFFVHAIFIGPSDGAAGAASDDRRAFVLVACDVREIPGALAGAVRDELTRRGLPLAPAQLVLAAIGNPRGPQPKPWSARGSGGDGSASAEFAFDRLATAVAEAVKEAWGNSADATVSVGAARFARIPLKAYADGPARWAPALRHTRPVAFARDPAAMDVINRSSDLIAVDVKRPDNAKAHKPQADEPPTGRPAIPDREKLIEGVVSVGELSLAERAVDPTVRVICFRSATVPAGVGPVIAVAAFVPFRDGAPESPPVRWTASALGLAARLSAASLAGPPPPAAAPCGAHPPPPVVAVFPSGGADVELQTGCRDNSVPAFAAAGQTLAGAILEAAGRASASVQEGPLGHRSEPFDNGRAGLYRIGPAAIVSFPGRASLLFGRLLSHNVAGALRSGRETEAQQPPIKSFVLAQSRGGTATYTTGSEAPGLPAENGKLLRCLMARLAGACASTDPRAADHTKNETTQPARPQKWRREPTSEPVGDAVRRWLNPDGPVHAFEFALPRDQRRPPEVTVEELTERNWVETTDPFTGRAGDGYDKLLVYFRSPLSLRTVCRAYWAPGPDTDTSPSVRYRFRVRLESGEEVFSENFDRGTKAGVEHHGRGDGRTP